MGRKNKIYDLFVAGNAAPPPLSRAIASSYKELLNIYYKRNSK